MKKRFEFKCWKCERNYTLFREITDEQELIVACPYCNAEGVVNLKPYRKEIKTVMRGVEKQAQDQGEELVLPDALPTQEKTN